METTKFANRHIGIEEKDLPQMLGKIGVKTLDELIDKTIPSQIRLKQPLPLAPAMTEREFAMHIAELASQNKLYKTYIGAGWYDSVTPAVIQRNVFENPVWYTSYTPYQAEISQGRLEALLNFQTVVSDLTAMPLANCSLLDESWSRYTFRRRRGLPASTGSDPHTCHSARHENPDRQLQDFGIYSRYLRLHRSVSEQQRKCGRLPRLHRTGSCCRLQSSR